MFFGIFQIIIKFANMKRIFTDPDKVLLAICEKCKINYVCAALAFLCVLFYIFFLR